MNARPMKNCVKIIIIVKTRGGNVALSLRGIEKVKKKKKKKNGGYAQELITI